MYQYLLVYIYSTNLKCKKTQTRKTIKIIDANQNRKGTKFLAFCFFGLSVRVGLDPWEIRKGSQQPGKEILVGPVILKI